MYPIICQLALPKQNTDHCPILLDSSNESWGPAHFCFELMWLEVETFSSLIQAWWKDIEVEGWAGFRLPVKLIILKLELKFELGKILDRGPRST